MFIGVDHGTRAIRFATSEGRCCVIPREEAGNLSTKEIMDRVKASLEIDQVDLLSLTYSMGDGLTQIVRIEDAINRGVISQEGAGLHVGGGLRCLTPSRNLDGLLFYFLASTKEAI